MIESMEFWKIALAISLIGGGAAAFGFCLANAVFLPNACKKAYLRGHQDASKHLVAAMDEKMWGENGVLQDALMRYGAEAAEAERERLRDSLRKAILSLSVAQAGQTSSAMH